MVLCQSLEQSFKVVDSLFQQYFHCVLFDLFIISLIVNSDYTHTFTLKVIESLTNQDVIQKKSLWIVGLLFYWSVNVFQLSKKKTPDTR